MECQVIDFGCDEGLVGFGNDCGCGCEQSAECPPVLDCEGGSCDPELEAKCPFSGRGL